jgi:flagellar hook assembly protein FlgD
MKSIILLLILAIPFCIFAEAPFVTSQAKELTSPESRISVTASPNPFRGSTTFTINQVKPTPVQVDIYDIRGRLVISLVPEYGQMVVWNGTNSAGQMVSSGVYIFRLKTGTYDVTHKIMLLK